MKPTSAVFLARRSYRLRRAMDAAQFLPVVGAFLVFLPLLWSGGSTRGGVVYLFLIWFILILVAAILSRWLKDPEIDRREQLDEGSG